MLKVATLYFLSFFVSLIVVNWLSANTSFIEFPYRDAKEMLLGSVYFTIVFTLFDWFILRKMVNKQLSGLVRLTSDRYSKSQFGQDVMKLYFSYKQLNIPNCQPQDKKALFKSFYLKTLTTAWPYIGFILLLAMLFFAKYVLAAGVLLQDLFAAIGGFVMFQCFCKGIERLVLKETKQTNLFMRHRNAVTPFALGRRYSKIEFIKKAPIQVLLFYLSRINLRTSEIAVSLHLTMS